MLRNIRLSQIFVPLLVIASILLAYIVGINISRAGETKVEVVALPGDSAVTMNGTPLDKKTIYIKPGEYTFTAKRQGFSDDTVTVTVDNQAQIVELLPEPSDEEGKRILEESPELQTAREAAGGRRASEKGASREEETPLIALLPVFEILGPFSMDYGPSENRKDGVFIEISDSSPKGRQNAIKWIRDHGSDPTDLEIRYTDYANPLTGGGL